MSEEMIHALLVVSALTLTSCGEKTAESLQLSPVSVASVAISDTVLLGQPVVFKTTCSTPTPCWEFERFEITEDGRQYNVKVFARYDGRPCIQILGSFKANSSVVPKERGTYTFRFWHTQKQSLDTTVVIQ